MTQGKVDPSWSAIGMEKYHSAVTESMYLTEKVGPLS